MKDYELEDYIADLKNELVEENMRIPEDGMVYDQTKESTNSATPTCWGTLPDEEFTPAFKSVDKVPAGIYEIVWNRQLSQHTIKKQPFKTDELYQLPSYEIQDILDLLLWKNIISRFKIYLKTFKTFGIVETNTKNIILFISEVF
jgi:hypothetical protein